MKLEQPFLVLMSFHLSKKIIKILCYFHNSDPQNISRYETFHGEKEMNFLEKNKRNEKKKGNNLLLRKKLKKKNEVLSL